jgi:hypothetical protein
MDEADRLRASLHAEGLSDELVDLVVERHLREEIETRARSVIAKGVRKAQELEERLVAIYRVLVAEPVVDFAIPLDIELRHPRWGVDRAELKLGRWGVHHLSFAWRSRGTHTGAASGISLGRATGPVAGAHHFTLFVARVGKVGESSFDVDFRVNARWLDGDPEAGAEAELALDSRRLVDFLTDRYSDDHCTLIRSELASLSSRLVSYFAQKDRALDGLDFGSGGLVDGK